jgi:hypothetical protein
MGLEELKSTECENMREAFIVFLCTQGVKSCKVCAYNFKNARSFSAPTQGAGKPTG